jgi:hypothetical protein
VLLLHLLVDTAVATAPEALRSANEDPDALVSRVCTSERVSVCVGGRVIVSVCACVCVCVCVCTCRTC